MMKSSVSSVACIIIGDHYYPREDESSDGDESMPGLELPSNFDDDSEDDDTSEVTDPLAIVLIDGQDDSSYMTDESMDFDEELSYDDSIEADEVPLLLSRGSSTSSDCSTVGNNANMQTVICESSYVCATNEDSSAATFTSHDDRIIDNIHLVTTDSGARSKQQFLQASQYYQIRSANQNGTVCTTILRRYCIGRTKGYRDHGTAVPKYCNHDGRQVTIRQFNSNH
jgi:hypothetical protein